MPRTAAPCVVVILSPWSRRPVETTLPPGDLLANLRDALGATVLDFIDAGDGFTAVLDRSPGTAYNQCAALMGIDTQCFGAVAITRWPGNATVADVRRLFDMSWHPSPVSVLSLYEKCNALLNRPPGSPEPSDPDD